MRKLRVLPAPSPRLLGLGRRLRDRRRAVGLSLARLGRALGIKYQHVQRWERGDYLPCLVYVELLCAELGCTPDYLLGYHDEE
jgi:transcriptional regulator with XRE-family HTH domain